MIRKAANLLQNNLLLLGWIVAIGASFGSLILSEVLDLIPCMLCWYQRAMMFPLAFVLGVGVYRKDANAAYYALPLSVVGSAIALYHSLLQWGIVKEVALTCSIDTSCAEPQINWLGFITIPFMSLISFSIITALMITQIRRMKK